MNLTAAIQEADVERPREAGAPLESADAVRRHLMLAALPETLSRREELGQVFTPAPIASLLASMLEGGPPRSTADSARRLLDAGAGMGALAAACLARWCGLPAGQRPALVQVTAYEIDARLLGDLKRTLETGRAACRQAGIECSYDVRPQDFIDAAVESLRPPADDLFGVETKEAAESFDCAVLNPPYRKINAESATRQRLRGAGIETSNLYTAFLWLTMRLLRPGGELVAIVPRSFANGPYFRPFREALLDTMTLRRVHLFDSRKSAFREADVLQENIVLHAIKARPSTGATVLITSSAGADAHDLEMQTERLAPYAEVVHPADPNRFVHLVPNELGQHVTNRLRSLPCSLADLGLEVSTGRVVDFRAKTALRQLPAAGTTPLIYPGHLSAVGGGPPGVVRWPKAGGLNKPEALALGEADHCLVPALAGTCYVLVKRFSAKEERRRVVAAVLDCDRLREDVAATPATLARGVGLENHLNYFHARGHGLEPVLARGLAAFLNSTLLDEGLRQFSGHTQVNATDLRSLRYPSAEQLRALGSRKPPTGTRPDQEQLDRFMEEELRPPAKPIGDETQPIESAAAPDPVQAKRRQEEALTILRALKVPREQQNARSALTLLALLDLRSDGAWSAETQPPARGITEMMNFIRDHYGVTYAPNTRETLRRQTIHQFIEIGLVEPATPGLAVNSPRTRYRIAPAAAVLLRAYGTAAWEKDLAAYLAEHAETLSRLHPRERIMATLPVTLPDGTRIELSGAGQNVLIKDVVEVFCPRFTPGGKVVYLGDAGGKLNVFDHDYLLGLGVSRLDTHGKLPDVVVHHVEKDWLILIEAVTSHGPIDIKRHHELKALFGGSRAGLVFVTAFESRRAMVRYLPQIAWETEVWAADAPTHLIHFNGERFLGPYEAK